MLRYKLFLLTLFLTTVSGLRLTTKEYVALQVRGGSTPFGSRTPAKLRKRRESVADEYIQSPERQEGNQAVATKDVIDAFLTRDSRNSFIARVYAILSVQLVIAVLSCLLFGLHPVLRNLPYMATSKALASVPLIAMAASTISFYRVLFSPNARRKSPNKWWWLSIFTVGEAVAVGFMSSFFKFESVIMSMGATALATLSVSMYTVLQKNPNRDLSQLGKTLSTWSIILMVYMLIGGLQQVGVLPSGFLPHSAALQSFFAAIFFSAFIAYDTSLIVGGKHSKYRLHEKDYVLGSMILYNDIVGLFLQLLQILGEEKR